MLNFLAGERRLRRIRDLGQDFARQMYDPSTMAPQRQAAERQATQGIDTAAVRGSALSQLGRSQMDPDVFSGSAGRAVGMMGQQNLNMARGLTDMETQLGLADQQARMQGRQAVADIQGRQLQTGAMRDAAITEADMMYEAELGSRRQALLGTGVTLGTMAGMGMFPGLKGGALRLINFLSSNDSLPPGAEETMAQVANMEVAPNPFRTEGSPLNELATTARDLGPADNPMVRAAIQQGQAAPAPAPAPTPARRTTQPTAPEEPAMETEMDAVEPVDLSPEEEAQTIESFVAEAQEAGIDINNMSPEELRQLYQQYQSQSLRNTLGFVARSPISALNTLSSIDQAGRGFFGRNLRALTTGMRDRQVDELAIPGFLQSLDPTDTRGFSFGTAEERQEGSQMFREQIGEEYQDLVNRIRSIFQQSR